MDNVTRYLTKLPLPNICVLAAACLVVAGMLVGSFSGGAIAVMLMAIYFSLPQPSTDVSLSLQTAYVIKTMVRKPKNETEQAAMAELQIAFDRVMK